MTAKDAPVAAGAAAPGSMRHKIAFVCQQGAVRLADGMNGRPLLSAVAIGVIVLIAAVQRIAVQPLDFDEVFTGTIAAQSTLSAIWRTLATGVEQMPPFTHVAIHTSQSLFGDNLIANRIPSLLGAAVLCLCLYLSIARYCSAVVAASAALSPLLMPAFDSAFIARPYGLLLGFVGVAWLCWDLATSRPRRLPALLGLTGAIALACSVHYYAPVALSPLAIGEIVRTWKRRRIDFAVWLAMAAGVLTLVFYIPLIRAAWGTVTAMNWVLSPIYVLVVYRTGIHPLLLAVTVGVGAAALCRRAGLSLFGEPAPQKGVSMPVHQLACLLGFAALPCLVFVSALLVTKIFHANYAIGLVIGVAGLLAVSTHDVADGKPFLPVLLLIAIATGVGLTAYKLARVPASWNPEIAARSVIFARESDTPVVMMGGTFLELWRAGGPALSKRLYYLSDRELARKYEGTDAWDTDMRALQAVARFHLEDYREFIDKHDRFLFYSRHGEPPWQMSQMAADGLRLELIGWDAYANLFAVTMKPELSGP